jgi:hypothetical protein
VVVTPGGHVGDLIAVTPGGPVCDMLVVTPGGHLCGQLLNVNNEIYLTTTFMKTA